MIDPKLIFPYSVNYPRNNMRKISHHTRFGYYDNLGRHKLDLSLGSAGCFLIGFDRKDIIQTVVEKISVLPFTSGEYMTTNNDILKLTERLFEMSNGYRSIFSLSGSDAIEGAIKVAAMYHMSRGKKKSAIIGFENSYHGSTYLAASVSGADYITGKFGRQNDCHLTSYDINAIRSKILEIGAENISAMIAETCSWQNGLWDYGIDYWKQVRQLCRDNDIIFILDDIAMCGGKTGSFFGFDLELAPDIFCLGKGFTGGFFPLSATLVSDRVFQTIKKDFLSHGFTYSFSMSGVYSAAAYMDALENEHILEGVPSIIETTKTRMDKLKEDGLLISHRNYGTFFCLQPVHRKDNYETVFYESGLNLGITNEGKDDLLIVIPLNADEEYFDMLIRRLRAALQPSKTVNYQNQCTS
jgi:putrescine aminotransferase